MVSGAAAGALPSTPNPTSRTRRRRPTGRTRTDWFERITPTRHWSTTRPTSSGGANSDLLPSSLAEWEDSAKLGVAAPDWRITCFFVDRDRRNQGVSEAGLAGPLC